MHNQPKHHSNNRLKKTGYLSEYESFDSESPSLKIRNIKTSKIMKKLKEIWNKQRYLTDDEFDSSKDQKGSSWL